MFRPLKDYLELFMLITVNCVMLLVVAYLIKYIINW